MNRAKPDNRFLIMSRANTEMKECSPWRHCGQRGIFVALPNINFLRVSAPLWHFAEHPLMLIGFAVAIKYSLDKK